MATAECRFGGGLNLNSFGELELYLKWKRNTSEKNYSILSYYYCVFRSEWQFEPITLADQTKEW